MCVCVRGGGGGRMHCSCPLLAACVRVGVRVPRVCVHKVSGGVLVVDGGANRLVCVPSDGSRAVVTGPAGKAAAGGGWVLEHPWAVYVSQDGGTVFVREWGSGGRVAVYSTG